MTAVVSSALRRALAGLVLCFGLLALVFTVMDRTGRPPATFDPESMRYAFMPPHSPWDIPIAIGLVAASVLAATLLYPGRSRRAAPTFPR